MALETFAYIFLSHDIAFSCIIIKCTSYVPWDDGWWDLNSELQCGKHLFSHWLQPSLHWVLMNTQICITQALTKVQNILLPSPYHQPYGIALSLPAQLPQRQFHFFLPYIDLQMKTYSLFTLVWKASLFHIFEVHSCLYQLSMCFFFCSCSLGNLSQGLTHISSLALN